MISIKALLITALFHQVNNFKLFVQEWKYNKAHNNELINRYKTEKK